jgi:hypothetical protein
MTKCLNGGIEIDTVLHKIVLHVKRSGSLQAGTKQLGKIIGRFNLKISTIKYETMTFQGRKYVRCEIAVDNN